MASRRSPARKILIWVIAIVIAIPVLFYLFEVVVPKLLPANF